MSSFKIYCHDLVTRHRVWICNWNLDSNCAIEIDNVSSHSEVRNVANIFEQKGCFKTGSSPL
jgi:hypothetical protein